MTVAGAPSYQQPFGSELLHLEHHRDLQAAINAALLVDDEGGPTFSVAAYGAVGDGGTDDTAAIQATIDDAAEVHGTVYFPPTAAYYKVDYRDSPTTITGYHGIYPALIAYDGIRLVGYGATIKAPAWDAASVALFGDSGGDIGPVGVSLHGLTLDGTGSGQEAEHEGIWFGPAVDLFIEDCRFLNFAGKGIQSLGVVSEGNYGRRIRVERCYFRNAWGNPIAIERGARDIWVTGNVFDGAASSFPGEAVILGGDQPDDGNYHIVGNTFDGWGSLAVESGVGVEIRDNAFIAHGAAAGPAVVLGPSSSVVISDNTVDLSPASSDACHAFALTSDGDYAHITITDNVITQMADVETSVILVQQTGTVTDLTVEGNSISGGVSGGVDGNKGPLVLKGITAPLLVANNAIDSDHSHSVLITGGDPAPRITGNDFTGLCSCGEPDATITGNRLAAEHTALIHADRSVVSGNRITSANVNNEPPIATYGTHSIVSGNVIENAVASKPWIVEDAAGDYNKFGPNVYVGASGSVVVEGDNSTESEF